MGIIFTFIYSSFLWAYILLFFVLVPFFALPFSLIFGLKRSFRLFFKTFAALGLAVFGSFPVVSGLENIPRGKKAILLANHPGFLDSYAINAALPRFYNHFIPGSVFVNPVSNITLKSAGIIVKHLGHPLSGSSVIRKSAAAVNKGDSFILFPSDRVIPDGTIDKIRAGIYRIIQDTDAVILPVHISGGIRFRFLQKPARPKIVIGKPIDRQHILYGKDAVIKQAISDLG